MRKLRLGIDVGGTFTDVVAIDAATRSLVASVKVPTTHDAPEGVAEGIVAGIERLLEKHAIAPEEVGFIAHSTTQATNSLLEGDVARVAVLGLLDGFEALSKAQIHFKPFELSPGELFDPSFAFVPARKPQLAERAVDDLARRGAEVVAVTQAFDVDRPQAEAAVVSYARGRDLFVTAGHEVSSMYGLRARSRTAALNAAILPKMVRTARMTHAAVARASIAAPLMIMRSDGGVMDVREIERRPILTLLSGPAAGVAGALLYENVTDGIFIEVGGTSSDCSAIRAGVPQMRPARIGGHRTMLRTVDVRTLPIAGGSLPRVRDGKIYDVGPRSAHIAGLAYAVFADPVELEGARVVTTQPTSHDPSDYIALVAPNGSRFALTPTCAANLLGLVPDGAFARGNAESARRGFEMLASHLQADAGTLARELLDIASAKVIAQIEELIVDYALDRAGLVVVGGGGGAAALLPHAAQRTKLDFRLARDAEVISPIGVALALVREVVERTIVEPSPEDIVRIRRQAQDAVIAAGASADNVDVSVEIDPQRNLVRATASGSSELAQTSARGVLDPDELAAVAGRMLRIPISEIVREEATASLTIFIRQRASRGRFGRVQTVRDTRVLDSAGIARLGLLDPQITRSTAAAASDDLAAALESATAFGDVGRALPDIYVLHGARIANFSGLADAAQVIALAKEELAGREPDAPVVILAAKKEA